MMGLMGIFNDILGKILGKTSSPAVLKKLADNGGKVPASLLD